MMREAKFCGVGVILAVCAIALLLMSWSSEAAAASAQSDQFSPDHILVKFKAGADIAGLHAANKTRTAKHGCFGRVLNTDG